MRLAIMQPYFFPYIGYFQLIAAVDRFVVYDNIKYTKKGWINRNRILQGDGDVMISLPLNKDSDYLMIDQREIADGFDPGKLLNQIKGAYHKAPFFRATYPLIEEIMLHPERNLFSFLHNSLLKLCSHLGIQTEICVSSLIDIDHQLKSQDKVIALCEAMHADVYINAIGGQELYSKDFFSERQIELKFIQSCPFEYTQLDNNFIPWLSIIDVLMFNPLDVTKQALTNNYKLI